MLQVHHYLYIDLLARKCRPETAWEQHYEKTHAQHLVGLVRALFERASEGQQSGGGSSHRRSLHEGGIPNLTSIT
ncbi:MAG: hypothetical protein MN733_27470 [Nitrososphaera sp.]|nr:hypothetical protein [Nitrososphaera sp.]